MLVLNRFVVPPEAQESFAERAHAALAALAASTGYTSGRLTRALDDPTHWTLVTEWESVGAYRRALGGFDVKVHATPLLSESLDEPSAFETLAAAGPGESVTVVASDRAANPWR
jgi:heme oxygenase (mycobilin-producing)